MSLLLPAGVVAHARPAAACINAVTYDTVPAIQQITLAEQALGAGKPSKAVAGLLPIFPTLRVDHRLMERGPGLGLDAVATRAQRVVAVALVRTEGLLAIGDSFPSSTAAERRANLEWAVGILRAFARVKSTPASQTDLGEALTKLPETREEALSILDGLDRKDLMTSPEGYAALAELRLAAGDRAGHDAARKRFEAMTPRAPRSRATSNENG